MASIFISYSRVDTDFVRRISTELTNNYGEVWVDQQSMMPASSWRQEIIDAITAADTLIFILSPNSLASQVSAQEVALALELKKRIIPIVISDIDVKQIPPESSLRALTEINWIFMRPQDNFTVGFEQLLVALNTDQAYWREASQLLVRAQQWQGKGRNPGFVLRGKELADAEQWLTEGATKRPTPTPLHTQFIATSRRVVTQQQRRTISLLTTGLIITLALAVISSGLFIQVNGQNATINQKNATFKINAIAARANTVLANNQIDQAALMDVFATRKQDTPETRTALAAALDAHPNLAAVLDNATTHSRAYGVSVGGNVQYSADGKTLLFAYIQGLEVFDMPAGKLRFPALTGDNAGSDAALSPDGKTIVVSTFKGLEIIDATNGTHIGELTNMLSENFNVHSVVISPNSRFAATTICPDGSCTTNVLNVWDIAQRKLVAQFTTYSTSTDSIALDFSPDGHTIAAADCVDDSEDCVTSWVEEWDITSQRLIAGHHLNIPTEGSAITLAFSPDGKTLAVGGKAAGCTFPCDQGQLVAYDAKTLTPRYIRVDPLGTIRHLAYTPDGHDIVTSAGDTNMRLRSAANGIPVSTQPIAVIPNTNGSFVQSLATSPDSNYFVTSDFSERLLLWRILPHSDLGLPVGPYINGTSEAIFTRDGRYVVTPAPTLSGKNDATNGMLYFWDLASRQVVASVPGPILHQQNTLLYSPDGKILAAGYNSGEVLLRDAQTKQILATLMDPSKKDPFPSILQLEFSSDGQLLLTSDDAGRTEIWDVKSHKVVHDFLQDAVPSSSQGAAFLDNHTVAFGTGVGTSEAPYTLVIADAHTGAMQRSFLSEPHRLITITFNPKNQTIVTVNDEGGVALWNRTSGTIAHRFNLSADQPNNSQLAGEKTLPTAGFLEIGRSHRQEIVAIVSNEFVFLDPDTLTPLSQPSFEAGQILSIEQSPDGSYLLIALQKGQLGAGYNPIVVRPLDLATQQQTACQVAHRNLTRTEWNDLIGTDYPYQTLCPEFP